MQDFFDQEPSPNVNRRKNRRKQTLQESQNSSQDQLQVPVQQQVFVPVIPPPPPIQSSPQISAPPVKQYEEEQIPSVDESNHSSHSFDCFAPHAQINRQEHSTFSAADISVQQSRINLVTEQSAELEFADDKTEKQAEVEQNSSQNEINEIMKAELSAYKQEVTSLNNQITELRKILDEFKNSNSVLNEQNIDINHQVQELQHQYQQLSNQNNTLQHEINQLNSSLAESHNINNIKDTQIQNLENKVQELSIVTKPEVQLTKNITRLPRQIRISQVFEDTPDIFPLNYNSNSQQLLSFLDLNIAKEKQSNNALPTYRALILAALRWRLIQTCPELTFLKSSDFLLQELLLEDFSDNSITGSIQVDLAPLNDVKLKLATGKLQEAAICAQSAGFFGISQLICKQEISFEKVTEQLPESCQEFMDIVKIFAKSDNEIDLQSNIFHSLGLTISQFSSLSFSELKYRFTGFFQASQNDIYLQQLILIIAGVPCHFNALSEFTFIKTGKSQPPLKPSNFQLFLQKMSKEFKTPPLEDFRLTELYEFTFAKQNLSKITSRMLPSYFTPPDQFDDLAVNSSEKPASSVLSYLSFFPHLLSFKAAFAGVSRKSAVSNKQIAKQALFYAEITLKNITFLVQFRPENFEEDAENDFQDEFSVYEIAVLPLKMTEQSVRFPVLSASFQIWTSVGRIVSSYRKEIRNMLKEGSQGLFSGENGLVELFYGREVEIPVFEVVGGDSELDEYFDEKSEEISGLEVNEKFEVGEEEEGEGDFQNPFIRSVSSQKLKSQQEVVVGVSVEKVAVFGGEEQVECQELPVYMQESVPLYVQEQVEIDVPVAQQFVQELEIEIEERQEEFNPEPVFIIPEIAQSNEPSLFADFGQSLPPPVKNVPPPIPTEHKEHREQEDNFFSASTPKSNKVDKKPEEPIKADPGKKLSKKWSSTFKRWVMVGEDGKEIPPEEDAIPPPPPSVPGVPPPPSSGAQQPAPSRRGAAGRYKSVQ